jgi:hypothetical protein
MGYSGAGGKLIHEKNQKQKISWHCPFKQKLNISRESNDTCEIFPILHFLGTLFSPFHFVISINFR